MGQALRPIKGGVVNITEAFRDLDIAEAKFKKCLHVVRRELERRSGRVYEGEHRDLIGTVAAICNADTDVLYSAVRTAHVVDCRMICVYALANGRGVHPKAIGQILNRSASYGEVTLKNIKDRIDYDKPFKKLLDTCLTALTKQLNQPSNK